MPIIIQEIVDDLQPLLTPYEAAFYWYFFRHSIAKDGNPRVRLKSRALQRGLVRSSQSNAIENQVSQTKVREVFRALETIGALRKEGEPNRDETPYRVLIPDEIEASRRFGRDEQRRNPRPKLRQPISTTTTSARTASESLSGTPTVQYCEKQLTRFTATLDHIKAVAEGGDNSLDNLVTACLGCNSRKHHRLVGDFLAEG